MSTKTADSKGRINFGPSFANKTFIIKDVDATEIRVIAAAVIPEREMWLYKNEKAMAAVERGLQDAAAGKVVAFDPHADDALLEELDD